MKFAGLLTRRFFLILHGIVVIFFFLACLASYINPAHCWPLAFLGLAFPFFVVLLIVFILFWLIIDAKWILLSIIPLLIGWKSLSVLIAWHLPQSSRSVPVNNLRILSYNVHYFRPYNDKPDKNNEVRDEMLSLIQQQHPDIACFQEFFTSENPKRFDFKSYISTQLNLPYRYFSSDYNYANNHSGVILFSRYPVIHAEKIKLQGISHSESAVFADILKDGDTLRIFTMHLQSIYLTRKDLADIEKLKRPEDSALITSRTVIGKLKRAFIERGLQTQKIAGVIRQSPYPVIVCGDFNDTPNSFSYYTVRGNLQDAFLKKGSGLGATYNSLSPTLLIDYIFLNNQSKVNNFYCIH